MFKNQINIAMLSTGDEVLNGEINDTNATWLSKRFFDEGMGLTSRVTVGDKKEEIAATLVALSHSSDVVIVNGGLGPTSDDLSAEAMASALNVELILEDVWLNIMRERYKKAGKIMPESNNKQAMLPKGMAMIPNPVGTACGFMGYLNKCFFYFTPGVPFEFKQMVNKEILPDLRKKYQIEEIPSLERFFTFGLSESWINDQFIDLPIKNKMSLGYRSALPFIEIKLLSRPSDGSTVLICEQIRKILADHIVSENRPMLDHIARLLKQKNEHLALCEYFTSGYLTAWLNQSKTLKDFFQQAWIKANLSEAENSLSTGAMLDEVILSAQKAREKAKVSIGLASGQCQQQRLGLALSTSKGDFALLVEVKKELEPHHALAYCSTLLLDMLRRYLESKSIFPSLNTSHLVILETRVIAQKENKTNI